ncbi:GH1 family beta-glucosidase [Deinococcus sp. YIM 134068]|uniref:GH1 family beta-glucosidase n=1 Tax=Deinococcus lichenicola TaxID=3118910 RepID=UPI002F94B2CD
MTVSETGTVRKADFPADFAWGTATAAYQIEGAVAEDGRSPSIWDTFAHTRGRVKGGDTGDVACDHYHRWREDLDLMAGLGLNAYRLSVAWPRVVPDGRGAVNRRGLDFYDRLTDGLLERGIAPYVTLYHWDLPQVLQDAGGWANRDTAHAFAQYADAVAGRLGDRVRGWVTHNEPWCAAFLGHMMGVHAPGLSDLETALRASHHLLLSHGLATGAIRAAVPNAQVGITLILGPQHAASDREGDVAAARRGDGFLNRWFLDPLYGRGYPADMLELYRPHAPAFESAIQHGDLDLIAVPTDFLGVNYYQRSVVKHFPGGRGFMNSTQLRPPGEYTAFDWEVYPDGLREILARVHKEYAPPVLYVTENGAAYDDRPDTDGQVHDEDRRRYLERHLAACREAIEGGVPLRGYFAWSLLDNFEWAEGYSKRFGLVRVDYETGRRTVKDSGAWYGRLARGETG